MNQQFFTYPALRALLATFLAVALAAASADNTPAKAPDAAGAKQDAATAGRPAARLFDDDFWNTGTVTEYDDEGRLVYVVKTRLVARSQLARTSDPNWIDPYTLNGSGYRISDPRFMRAHRNITILRSGQNRPAPATAVHSTTGARTVSPPAPRSRTPSSSRRSSSPSGRRSER